MKSHVFFDLDNTLWDFKANSRDTLTELYAYFKLNTLIPDIELFIEKYEEYNAACWAAYQRNEMRKDFLRHQRFFLTLAHFSFKNRTLAKKLGAEYVARSPLKTKLLPHAMEVVKQLYSEFPLHIITNGFQEVQGVKLRESGLAPYFKEIITSERAGYKKPSPQIFQLALKRSGASAPQSWMIGDDYQADALGGMQAGFRSIWLEKSGTEPDRPDIQKVICLSEVPALIVGGA
jgi:putative hydrolase of the HAD superfamily